MLEIIWEWIWEFFILSMRIKFKILVWLFVFFMAGEKLYLRFVPRFLWNCGRSVCSWGSLPCGISRCRGLPSCESPWTSSGCFACAAISSSKRSFCSIPTWSSWKEGSLYAVLSGVLAFFFINPCKTSS